MSINIKKNEILLFLVILLALTLGHLVLIAMAQELNQFFYSGVPILFVLLQTCRIFRTGIEYKGWLNSEIKPSTNGFIIIGIPIPYFSYTLFKETGLWYWLSLIILILFSALMILTLLKIYWLRDSFYSSGLSFKDIKKIIEQNSISYKKPKKNTRKIGLDIKNSLYLPSFDCEIFDINNKIVVNPKNKKNKNNISTIIDLFEGET